MVEKRIYPNNFLKEVIFRIDFHPISELMGEKGTPETIQEFITKSFPQLETHEQNNVTFVPDNQEIFKEASIDKNKIWEYKQNDEKKLELTPSSLVLVYNGEYYSSHKEILNDMSLILDGLKACSVKSTSALGLRYINEIIPKEKKDWNKWIDPNLHNFNAVLQEDGLIRSISKIEYKIDDYFLSFQFGQFNLNYPSTTIKDDFVLDYDCYTHSVDDINNLEDNFKNMNKIIRDFFEKSICEDLRKEMGVKDGK